MSPLSAAWSANPHLCNSVVYSAGESRDISPVPVIDPTLGNWVEELELAAEKTTVRMVKLLPGYNGYDLAVADDLFKEACRIGLAVMVQVRIDDPRRHQPLWKVPDVPVADIVEAAEDHPELKLIIGGASTRIIRYFSSQLRALPGLYSDTSQVDGVDGVKMLIDDGLEGKLLFGSHAPVFMPAASVARVLNDIPDATVKAIMRDNAAALLMT